MKLLMGIVLSGLLLIGWSCLVAAGEADRRAERIEAGRRAGRL